jgi:hypothetical protein
VRALAGLLLAVLVTGCAVGRVRPGDGQMDCWIVGQAKCERLATGETRIEGGMLSGNATTVLTAIIAGAIGYFAHGAL